MKKTRIQFTLVLLLGSTAVGFISTSIKVSRPFALNEANTTSNKSVLSNDGTTSTIGVLLELLSEKTKKSNRSKKKVISRKNHSTNKPIHSSEKSPTPAKTRNKFKNRNKYKKKEKLSTSKWKDKTTNLKNKMDKNQSIVVDQYSKMRMTSKAKNLMEQNADSVVTHDVDEALDIESYENTRDHLETIAIGTFTAGQAHETGKQIFALSKRNSDISGPMCDMLIRRLVEEKQANNTHSKLSPKLFNSAIDALIKSKDVHGYQKAVDLISMMHDTIEVTSSNSKQVAKCYWAIIEGCQKTKSKAAADAAFNLFHKLETLGIGNRDVMHLNIILSTYESAHDHKSVFQIWKMIKEGQMSDMKLNRRTFNIIIKALVSTNSMRCIRRAEEILNIMEQSYKHEDASTTPDRFTFTLILSAWAHVGLSYDKSIEKCEEYLTRMQKLHEKGLVKVKPDRITYNTVLNIIANSKAPKAGAKCLKILEKMDLLYECGDRNVRPSTASYNSVIKAFSNDALNDGARRALMMLKKLENHGYLKPDIISYNTVLGAFAKCTDPIAAQVLLDNMERRCSEGFSVKPDTVSYNTVMFAWSVSKHRRSAEIVETIFDRMETSGVRLDTTTFNTLLGAWGRQKDDRAAERATDILHHMFAVKQSGQYDVRPTSQSFAIAMNAWAKSNDSRKAYRARELLIEMKSRYKNGYKLLRPNSYIYSTILNACAFTYSSEEARKEAIHIAITTYRECAHRNDIVYGTFIKACSMLFDPEDNRKIQMIESAFLRCVKAGQVSNFVLEEMFNSVPMPFYQDLVGNPKENILSVTDVPSSWSCNVIT